MVQLTFDPAVISFPPDPAGLFTIHDPTTLNRQGADIGTQYRSVIFYHSSQQQKVAEQVVSEIESAGVWQNPIVTEIAPLDIFYAAEDYHQDYFARNRGQPYCQVVIEPKVAKFRKQFLEQLNRAQFPDAHDVVI